MIYDAPKKHLNEQVKRNFARFPEDFVFQLTSEEMHEVVTNCDHLARLEFLKLCLTPPLDKVKRELAAGLCANASSTREVIAIRPMLG